MENASGINKEGILKKLIEIIEDMTSDWDLEYDDGINANTKLIGDLLFESIEIVQLMVSIEQHFALKNLASEKLLIRDGRYVPDITIQEIVNFLNKEMSKQ